MVAAGDGGGGGYSQGAVAADPSSGGFNWSYAAIGAGIALGVAFVTAASCGWPAVGGDSAGSPSSGAPPSQS